MITEEQLALISIAVDGELSPAETSRFRRLLDTSAEARALYVRLKSDSARLGSLPQAAPPANLKPRIMARIGSLTPPPGTLPLAQPCKTIVAAHAAPTSSAFASRSRLWVPAVAASLLLGIMGASFWYLTRDSRHPEGLARKPGQPPASTQRGAQDPEWAKWLPTEHGPRLLTPAPAPRTDSQIAQNGLPTPVVPPVAVEEPRVALAPPPRTAINPNVMGSEWRPEIGPLDLIQAPPPFLHPLADFDQEGVRSEFTEELGHNPALRIDVFTRNLPRSVDCVRAATKASGVSLFADSTTLARVSSRQVYSYVVYTESLTGAELADLFVRLEAEDARISPRIFDMVHAVPAAAEDQKSIHAILGIDPGLFKRPRLEKEKPLDSARPLSAGTADQIVKSLNAARAAEKTAVLMTWLPALGRTMPEASQELKQFLSKRGERKPNALPVVIIIRHRDG